MIFVFRTRWVKMNSDSCEDNAAINGLLQSTSKLRSSTYYRKHIACTPVQPIQDTGICYSPDLKLLLCLGCGRVQSPHTCVRHLKRQHRSTYNRLNKRSLLSIRQEIGRLHLDQVEDLGVRHNVYYFSGLPVTFQNFKCRDCNYVDINRKNVRNHFRSRHPLPAKSVNQKVDYVLEDIPLQVLEGFPNNRKFYFIPKLPDIRARAPPSHDESANGRPDARSHPVSDSARAAILDAHRKSIEERENEQPYNDAVTNNKKLLNSFLTNSNVLDFLRGKDRGILVDLVGPPSTSSLEVEKGWDFELLEKNVLTFMLEVHKYVPNLTRRFRQLLKTEDGSRSYKEMKDFIQLSTPEPHFKKHCRLVTFIVRVHLIRENYKQEASDELKSKYFDTTEHIHLSEETTGSIKELTDLGVKPIQDDTDQQYGPAFRNIISRIFHSLLKDPIHLKVKENATFKNPVIHFYFSSILNPQTKEILDGPMVSKIASIFIYNTRLLFLAHYYNLEDNQALEEGELNRLYEEEVRRYLSNNSKNYFEELTQIRAYSLKLSKQYKSTTYTIKESPAGTVEFNGIPYPIEHIRDFFARLGVQLETHLTSKLLFVNHLDSLGIEFNRIEDTPLLNKTGNSIVDTPQLERFKSWFLKELLTEGSEYNRFFVKDTQDSRIRFKRSNVQRFMADLHVFTELLANAINLYSGGPLRGTELNLILYKNTTVKDRSMMYNKDAEMFFITTNYNKTENITRKGRSSNRYIIPMLSRLIIVLVAAVLPLRDYIYQHHYQDEAFDNPYLLARNQGSVSSYSTSMRLQKETAGHFRKGLSLQAWRKMINFIIKTKMHATPLDSDGSGDSSDSDDLMEDKQANRSTRVSFNHYFNAEYLANTAATPKELNALRDFSITYFNYFNLLDDFDRTRQDNGTMMIISHPEQPEMITLDNRGLLQRLRRLYGDPKANFLNNEQKNCVSQVLSGRPYITYINRTGSGKSLVYLLPAFIKSDHLYVIITPRLALKDDLYRRACDLKLRPSRFEDPITYHSNLMFCSVEDLDSQELKLFIERHKTFGRDVTVMLDEAHLFLIEVSFRLKLRDLASILQYKANVVFITATLPRPLLHLLNTTFGISNFNSIIRGSSNRSDISYRRVYFRSKEDRDEAVRKTIRNIHEEDGDVGNKILIFVTSKRQGEDLAELLGSEVVYSGKEDLQPTLQEFIQSKSQRTLVTTSVLEVGIDIKQIKYTISIEPIYSLTSIVQSSGRIRQRGVSYIICQQPSKYGSNEIRRNSRVQREVRNIEDFSNIDKAWYRLLTIEETCLRMPVSQFLDHVPYRCQGHKDDLCSVCMEKGKIKEETRWAEEAKVRERRGQWLELEDNLLRLKEMYCMYCILDPYNTSDSINHALVECKRAPADRVMLQLREAVPAELRVQKLPPSGCGCFRCLMPKNICVKQQEANGLAGEECFTGTFLPDMVAVLFRFREVVEGIMPGVPTGVAQLCGFVNRVMAPSGIFSLKTVRLVEILGKVDVVKLVEELEEGSSSESESEEKGECGDGQEAGNVGRQSVENGSQGREGRRSRDEESDYGVDLTMPSPRGEWTAEGREGGSEAGGRAAVGSGERKRRASKSLSQRFAEEKGRLKRRGIKRE
jgi:superfamily II DNA/RNA helicase